jgi:hypothetical protein
MTKGDWDKVLRGDADREVVVDGEHTMARYLVADAISARAKEVTKERPDKAGVLRQVESKVRGGYAPSKELLSKVAKELEIVQKKIVDGTKLVDA